MMRNLIIAAIILILTVIVWIIFRNMKKLEHIVRPIQKLPQPLHVVPSIDMFSQPRTRNTQVVDARRTFIVFMTFDVELIPGTDYYVKDYISVIVDTMLKMSNGAPVEEIDALMSNNNLTMDIVVSAKDQVKIKPGTEFMVETCTKADQKVNNACLGCRKTDQIGPNQGDKFVVIDEDRQEQTCLTAGQSFKKYNPIKTRLLRPLGPPRQGGRGGGAAARCSRGRCARQRRASCGWNVVTGVG